MVVNEEQLCCQLSFDRFVNKYSLVIGLLQFCTRQKEAKLIYGYTFKFSVCLYFQSVWSDFHQFTIKQIVLPCELSPTVCCRFRRNGIDSPQMGFLQSYGPREWECTCQIIWIAPCHDSLYVTFLPPLDMNGLPNPSSKCVAVFGKNLAFSIQWYGSLVPHDH